ncbi:MAG: ribonuclease Z [candidate division TA06 bacterium ADurb.Bin417]|uniref:Ribonuclease Z n=1 Tax=candidate division TA06 bacterium ADurb.Bin417 TaxID=1852828 RepID=A0A1V5MJN0_UNCT6|nr:MAG: ribonuclease Z [candidate division TA06 bacterium ADurb.Bin417]
MAFIKFLGTAGARFVMIEQLRASGGLWISSGDQALILDPGPGSLVRAIESVPRLDPAALTGVLLSHKHLDHSGDVNVMIEAMTSGGFKKKGALFAPADAFDPDPVILHYLAGFPERVEHLKAGATYQLGDIEFTAVKRLNHPVETYGFNFRFGNETVSLISDTGYFEGIEDGFTGRTLIINVVMIEPRSEIRHLSLPEAEMIIGRIRPERAILTHFGRNILTRGPEQLAREMSDRLKLEVQAAVDGLLLQF